MSVLDLILANVRCFLRGHDMHQLGYLEQCKRCGETWWDLYGSGGR